jgi:hypothetical protein
MEIKNLWPQYITEENESKDDLRKIFLWESQYLKDWQNGTIVTVDSNIENAREKVIKHAQLYFPTHINEIKKDVENNATILPLHTVICTIGIDGNPSANLKFGSPINLVEKDIKSDDLKWFIWENTNNGWGYGLPLLMVIAKSKEDAQKIVLKQHWKRDNVDSRDYIYVGNVGIIRINLSDVIFDVLKIQCIDEVFFFDGA